MEIEKFVCHKCVNCGKLFEPEVPTQNLCSKPCRVQWLDRPLKERLPYVEIDHGTSDSKKERLAKLLAQSVPFVPGKL